MSIVNTSTGEIVDLDRPAAERRAERINLRLDAIADNYAAVMPMIREAIEKRDDLALGYRSPGEYVADRFGGALQRLGVEVRREVVRELTAAGMSTRAIAPVVGVNNATVHRDLARVADATPQTPASVDGEDPARDQEQAQSEPTEAEPAPTCERPEPIATVTGLDGKTYTRPSAPVLTEAERLAKQAERDHREGMEREAKYLMQWTAHYELAANLRGYAHREEVLAAMLPIYRDRFLAFEAANDWRTA